MKELRETLSLPATLPRVADAVDFARAGAKSAGLGPPKVFSVEVAVEEAVMNVCRHAYRDREAGEVTVRLLVSPGALVVEVEDEGPLFDPIGHPEPDIHAPLAERKIGGLGILMIRKLVDEVSWRRQGGRNVLSMTVRR